MSPTSTVGRSTAVTDDALARATTSLHLRAADCLARLAPSLGASVWPGHPAHDLVSHLIADLVSAGLPVSDGAGATGGVLVTAGGDARGPIVRWTAHAVLTRDPSRRDLRRDVELLLDFALDDVLCALGWQTELSATDGARVVTGRLPAARRTGGES